ncbi:MAG: hypothetical protein H6830_10910 [Planctomycetes bacterium]|nr:hypothetical protein [Planctomycetota bacterium]MCB9908217.1 hypothetical protein [Planctomycetota bacterium]HPF13196.1 hypothetical protein [Planctomycetota bacterium]HRV79870.1 hypothetical protein [Planctomycetota bacterium]
MSAIQIYQLLHVVSILFLTATTFMAFANPSPERRKRMLMLSGILSLTALTGGFGLLARFHYGFPAWAIVKLVCWLVLSALSGLAFRKPQSIKLWTLLATVCVVTAVCMVYLKPGV